MQVAAGGRKTKPFHMLRRYSATQAYWCQRRSTRARATRRGSDNHDRASMYVFARLLLVRPCTTGALPKGGGNLSHGRVGGGGAGGVDRREQLLGGVGAVGADGQRAAHGQQGATHRLGLRGALVQANARHLEGHGRQGCGHVLGGRLALLAVRQRVAAVEQRRAHREAHVLVGEARQLVELRHHPGGGPRPHQAVHGRPGRLAVTKVVGGHAGAQQGKGQGGALARPLRQRLHEQVAAMGQLLGPARVEQRHARQVEGREHLVGGPPQCLLQRAHRAARDRAGVVPRGLLERAGHLAQGAHLGLRKVALLAVQLAVRLLQLTHHLAEVHGVEHQPRGRGKRERAARRWGRGPAGDAEVHVHWTSARSRAAAATAAARHVDGWRAARLLAYVLHKVGDLLHVVLAQLVLTHKVLGDKIWVVPIVEAQLELAQAARGRVLELHRDDAVVQLAVQLLLPAVAHHLAHLDPCPGEAGPLVRPGLALLVEHAHVPVGVARWCFVDLGQLVDVHLLAAVRGLVRDGEAHLLGLLEVVLAHHLRGHARGVRSKNADLPVRAARDEVAVRERRDAPHCARVRDLGDHLARIDAPHARTAVVAAHGHLAARQCRHAKVERRGALRPGRVGHDTELLKARAVPQPSCAIVGNAGEHVAVRPGQAQAAHGSLVRSEALHLLAVPPHADLEPLDAVPGLHPGGPGHDGP
mmetsp:Transcript_4227/g.13396  ORF Transcript_4227/g.13396 Transcript_4227/m.13396 type:complete len:698 (-) Transcript_4227:764-2857(-)